MKRIEANLSYLGLTLLYLITFILRLFQFADSYDFDKAYKIYFSFLFLMALIYSFFINNFFLPFVIAFIFGLATIFFSVFASYYDSINEDYCSRTYAEFNVLYCKNKQKYFGKFICDFVRKYTLRFFDVGFAVFGPLSIVYFLFKATEAQSLYLRILYPELGIYFTVLTIIWHFRYSIYVKMRMSNEYTRNREKVKYRQRREQQRAERKNYQEAHKNDRSYYNPFGENASSANEASASKYFCGCKNLSQLKERYRKLAKTMHPDVGGDEDLFQEMSSEYDSIYEKWKEKGL